MFGDSATQDDFFSGSDAAFGAGAAAAAVSSTSMSSPGGKKAPVPARTEQSLLPLTIDQIVDMVLPAEEEAMMVDGVEINHVSFTIYLLLHFFHCLNFA